MNLLNLGAFDITTFCSSMGEIIQIIGYVILIVKVAIPLLIIAFGVLDFGKAVVAEKEDEIKKSTKRLLYRVLAGVVIFLVPNIITFVFGAIGGYNTVKDKAGFDQCETCFLEPWNCDVD